VKVLHVEAGRHLYGGALQVVFLLRGLATRGVETVLACPLGSAIAETAAPHALRVAAMPMKGDLDILMVGRLRRLIRAERPDIVHLHSRRGAEVWGGLAARLEGVPAVMSRRVDNPEPRVWVALKYRLYDRIITISQGIRAVLLAEGVPPERVVCVPSAVDTERYRPTREYLDWFRREFDLSDDQLTLAMVAQFIPRKGHRVLLEALPAIVARHPNVRVLLFGRGAEQAAIRRAVAARPALASRVVFAGFRDDLHRVLPCIDVVVHPASMEGLGVALLQAAACGVPIVAGRVGGIPEIVEPGVNGELIDPGDAAALAEHVSRLLQSEELRRRYGHAGRRRVERAFSIDAMVEGNLAVYRDLAARRQRRG
jgi:glycosyltransferase involved in cell wall biosynthesis